MWYAIGQLMLPFSYVACSILGILFTIEALAARDSGFGIAGAILLGSVLIGASVLNRERKG